MSFLVRCNWKAIYRNLFHGAKIAACKWVGCSKLCVCLAGCVLNVVGVKLTFYWWPILSSLVALFPAIRERKTRNMKCTSKTWKLCGWTCAMATICLSWYQTWMVLALDSNTIAHWMCWRMVKSIFRICNSIRCFIVEWINKIIKLDFRLGTRIATRDTGTDTASENETRVKIMVITWENNKQQKKTSDSFISVSISIQ